MNISIEQIDEIRKRTNCSYQEARELLQKHDGDIIEAVIEFEQKQGHRFKQKTGKNEEGYGGKFKRLIHKGFVTRFVIEKDENTILNISLNILLLAVLFTMPIFWLYPLMLILLYLLGYKIRIRKGKGQEVDINQIVDGISSRVKTATEKISEVGKEEDELKKEEKKDDGYNEIIVE